MLRSRIGAKAAVRQVRDVASLALVSFVFLAASALVLRAESEIIKSHGYSYFGKLSYPETYTHLAM
jgi:hypothetical protein